MPPHDAVRALVCLLSAALGLGVTVFCYFPGYMWYDSLSQLRMARSGSLEDLVPPVMTYAWGLLDRIVPGRPGLLVLNATLFWSGLGLLVYLSTVRRALIPLVVLGIGFFPPVFGWLGALVKDVTMASALLLGYALIRFAERWRSLPAWGLSGLCLLFGLSARHDAAPAILPLCLLAGSRLSRYLPAVRRAPLPSIALGLIAFAALMLLSGVMSDILTRGRHSHPAQLIMLHDLAAISIGTGSVVMPPFVYADWPSLSLQDLQELYSPDNTPQFPAKKPSTYSLKYRYQWSAGEFQAFVGLWAQSIRDHPSIYLAHRASAFLRFLGVGREYVCDPFYEGPIRDESNWLGLSEPGQGLYQWSLDRLGQLRTSVLFRGWFYVAILAIVSVACLVLRPRSVQGSLALCLSGLLYTLAHFFASTCEFRYLWWTVLAACTLPVALLIPDSPAAARVGSPRETG